MKRGLNDEWNEGKSTPLDCFRLLLVLCLFSVAFILPTPVYCSKRTWKVR